MRINSLLFFAGLLLCSEAARPQTRLHLPSQSRNADFSEFLLTSPFRVFNNLPENCTTGNLLFRTGVAAGSNLYGCVNGVWSLQGRTAVQNVSTTGFGIGIVDAGDGSILLRRLNTNNNKLSINLDSINQKLDLDIIESSLNIGQMSGLLPATRILSRQGNGTKALMFGTGTPQQGQCAQFDAGGNIESTGAPCAESTLTVGPGLRLVAGQMRVEAAEVPSYLQAVFNTDWSAEPVTAATCGEQTIAFLGAALLDSVTLGVPENFPGSAIAMGLIKTPGVVTLRICNLGGDPIEPSGEYRVWLHKRF